MDLPSIPDIIRSGRTIQLIAQTIRPFQQQQQNHVKLTFHLNSMHRHIHSRRSELYWEECLSFLYFHAFIKLLLAIPCTGAFQLKRFQCNSYYNFNFNHSNVPHVQYKSLVRGAQMFCSLHLLFLLAFGDDIVSIYVFNDVMNCPYVILPSDVLPYISKADGIDYVKVAFVS